MFLVYFSQPFNDNRFTQNAALLRTINVKNQNIRVQRTMLCAYCNLQASFSETQSYPVDIRIERHQMRATIMLDEWTPVDIESGKKMLQEVRNSFNFNIHLSGVCVRKVILKQKQN